MLSSFVVTFFKDFIYFALSRVYLYTLIFVVVDCFIFQIYCVIINYVKEKKGENAAVTDYTGNEKYIFTPFYDSDKINIVK